jgi:phosphopantothenoylcysteine decarboxylase/phosphopantothenate--cysteine ligase
MNILFQLTGSIACFKACSVISALVKQNHAVQVVATSDALKFVGEATLEGLTGRPVATHLYAAGRMMDHIHLNTWADLIILCPATANTLNKMAAGVGDDLVSTLFLAFDFSKPYVIAPAMNTKMLNHPATQASMQTLKGYGVKILATGSGQLACGDVGDGRLLEPEDILQHLKTFLSANPSSAAPAPLRSSTGLPLSDTPGRSSASLSQAVPSHEGSSDFVELSSTPRQDLTGIRLLVTAGGTREPIDGVRFITNASTGATGTRIALDAANHGAQVTLLTSNVVLAECELAKIAASTQVKILPFDTFQSLQNRLRTLLHENHFDSVIHSAAVSDFSVNRIVDDMGSELDAANKKISSNGGLRIEMRLNPKLIDHLRTWSVNPNIQVIGFKLTANASPAEQLHAVVALLDHANCDFVVQNDASEVDTGRHVARIFDSDGRKLTVVNTKEELSLELSQLIRASRPLRIEVGHDLSP